MEYGRYFNINIEVDPSECDRIGPAVRWICDGVPMHTDSYTTHYSTQQMVTYSNVLAKWKGTKGLIIPMPQESIIDDRLSITTDEHLRVIPIIIPKFLETWGPKTVTSLKEDLRGMFLVNTKSPILVTIGDGENTISIKSVELQGWIKELGHIDLSDIKDMMIWYVCGSCYPYSSTGERTVDITQYYEVHYIIRTHNTEEDE